MNKTILLFDMDGVLIRSRGYYLSLQSAIKLLGRDLGVESAELDMDEISMLEAIGVSHIWDHLTIISSFLIFHVWTIYPQARFPKTLDPSLSSEFSVPAINFSDYINDLKLDRIYRPEEVYDLIKARSNQLNSDQKEYLDLLVQSNRDIYGSPVVPIMQELILGSQLFQETYDLPSQLNLKSYPQQYDKPALSEINHDHLQRWLTKTNHHAAIFTNRPNIPPDKSYFGTPETEIGQKIINFEDLPVMGAGSLEWMADKTQTPPGGYKKPDPVHALAAIQVALGQSIEISLERAISLINQNQSTQITNEWGELNQASVFVFEDSVGGLLSAQKAGQILADVGIPNKIHLIGIGQQSEKIGSLLKISDEVYSDINSSILIDIITQ